jgi:undecaprenyl-diphosphatase
MDSFDTALTAAINAPAGTHPLMDTAMSAITTFGVPLLIIAVALQWFLKDNSENRRHALIAVGLSFAAGQLFNQFVLLFFHRMRPYDAGVSHLIIEKSADWSFPSDHTTAVVAIAAAFALLGYRTQALLFGLAAILVCYSRIYVGMHYASDILGGTVTALIAAGLVSKAYNREWPINRRLVKIL